MQIRKFQFHCSWNRN